MGVIIVHINDKVVWVGIALGNFPRDMGSHLVLDQADYLLD